MQATSGEQVELQCTEWRTVSQPGASANTEMEVAVATFGLDLKDNVHCC